MCTRLEKDHINSLIHRIETAVEKSFENSEVTVTDPLGTGHHFEVTVVSKKFEGLSLVNQHKMVYASLKDLFADDLHAIVVKTIVK